MTEATVAVDEPEPGRLRIAVAGEVDLENVARVEQQLQAVITNRTRSVLLDLGGLGYLDSAGLRALFGLGRRLDLLQVELEIRVPVGSPVRRAVEISGLGTAVRVRAD